MNSNKQSLSNLYKNIILESFIRKTRILKFSTNDKSQTIDKSFPAKTPLSFVCFPFQENYHRQEDPPASPNLSSFFLEDKKWELFATEYLTLRTKIADNPYYTLPCMEKYKYCEIDSLPSEDAGNFNKLPIAFTDSISIEKIIFENSTSIIYLTKVTQPNSSIQFYCVAKVVKVQVKPKFNYILCRIKDSSWSKKKLLKDNYANFKKFVISSAFSEPIALSKIKPSSFYGSALFFNKSDKLWYVASFMPYYKGNFWNLTTRVLDLFDDCGREDPNTKTLQTSIAEGKSSNLSWIRFMLDCLMQIILYTIPKLKSGHLISHNDLKIDNIAYEQTSKKCNYIQIFDKNGSCIFGDNVLAIATNGRKFRAIDLGWSSVQCKKEKVLISSACTICNLPKDTKMRVWNFYSDYAQVGYSMVRELQDTFKTSAENINDKVENPDWFNLLDAVGYLCCIDDLDTLYKIETDELYWCQIFYAQVSKNCHFQKALKFIEIAKTIGTLVPKDQVPKNRAIFQYNISLLFPN